MRGGGLFSSSPLPMIFFAVSGQQLEVRRRGGFRKGCRRNNGEREREKRERERERIERERERRDREIERERERERGEEKIRKRGGGEDQEERGRRRSGICQCVPTHQLHFPQSAGNGDPKVPRCHTLHLGEGDLLG